VVAIIVFKSQFEGMRSLRSATASSGYDSACNGPYPRIMMHAKTTSPCGPVGDPVLRFRRCWVS